MTNTLQQVLDLLTPTQQKTAADIAAITSLDITTVRKKLAVLREDGRAVLEVAADGTRYYSVGYPATPAPTTEPVADAPAPQPATEALTGYYVRDKNKRLKPQKPMLHKTSRPDANRTRCGLETEAEYVRLAEPAEVGKVPECPVCFKRISRPVADKPKPKKGPGGNLYDQSAMNVVQGPDGLHSLQPVTVSSHAGE